MRFLRYEDFWGWCMNECQAKHLGCAKTCIYRIKLKIPPHGPSYRGKLSGPIDTPGGS